MILTLQKLFFMRKFYLLVFLAIPILLAGCKKDDKGGVDPSSPNVNLDPMPVVFHVLYENPSSGMQSPNASVFINRIDSLNRFFAAALNGQSASAKVDVAFKLADKAPDGTPLAEPGIHRVQYSGANNLDPSIFLDGNPASSKNAQIYWDANKYINIWVFGFQPSEPGFITTGIAYLAYATTMHPLAGLSGSDVNAKGEVYFFQKPTLMHGIALNNKVLNTEEGVLTLIHEMGHYLGLFHAFSEPNAGNQYDACRNTNDASDDYCGDTPKYDRVTYGEEYPMLAEVQRYYRRSCAGQVFRSTNVMDYFYSDRVNFTPEQRARMEHVLAYSPLIPRSDQATKALLDRFTGEITDQLPKAIKMY